MTIKSIAKICKSHKEVIRHTDAGGNEWIGFNNALYLVPNLPKCDNKQLAAIFDIPPEKYEKMTFSSFDCPDDTLFDDINEAENLLERVKIKYIIDGIEYEPIKTSRGIVLINTEYLAPFNKVKNGIELYERFISNGSFLIIAKSGFEILGILGYMPMPKEFIDYEKKVITYAEMFSAANEQISFNEMIGGNSDAVDG